MATRTIRIDAALWADAKAAAREHGYRSVDVYVEDCLRRLVSTVPTVIDDQIPLDRRTVSG
jgi:hypothetical protein